MSAIPYPGGLLAAIQCATRPCELDKYIAAAIFKNNLAECGTTRAARSNSTFNEQAHV